MGQYLAVGICNRVYSAKKDMERSKLTADQLVVALRHELRFDPEIYEQRGFSDAHGFDLKESVFNEGLLPLLETIYPFLYEDPQMYASTLEQLRSMEPAKWVGWAKTKPQYTFQYSDYGHPDYIKGWPYSVPVHYQGIMLSLEGKILMEEYGRLFAFASYAMRRCFADIPLAGALRMQITG